MSLTIITQCYLPLDASELAPPNTNQTGWYSINLSRSDGKLSWPIGSFVHTEMVYRYLSAKSPIQVVTRPDVEQLPWSRPAC